MENMQEFAKQNIHRFGFLLLLDCPRKMRFSIDNQEWRINDKFKGLKLIPPGPHIVHYSLDDENHL